MRWIESIRKTNRESHESVRNDMQSGARCRCPCPAPDAKAIVCKSPNIEQLIQGGRRKGLEGFEADKLDPTASKHYKKCCFNAGLIQLSKPPQRA